MPLMARSRGREGVYRESAGKEVQGEGRDGFTLYVSAAVETTGCIPAQHMRCGRVSVDGELLFFAKLWAAPARPGARGRRRPKTPVAPPGDFWWICHALDHFL